MDEWPEATQHDAPAVRDSTLETNGRRPNRPSPCLPSAALGRMVSMCTSICVIAALALGGSAQADCISQTVGTTTIHNCDGKISTSHTVGSTTVHNINGKTGVSQTVGSTTVHSFNGKLGTSQTIGKTTIHNIDGKFGMSQTIGAITIHSGPLFDAP